METIESSYPGVVDGQDTHLSGAYIRSLVKQLTTSSSSTSSSSSLSPPSTPPKKSQYSKAGAAPHKKQVRRRLHTTRPYQERLLNMAEARKEIVTALKFHRASKKHQPVAPPSPPPVMHHPCYVAPPLLLPSQTLGLSLNLDAACLYTANNIVVDDAISAPSPLSVLPEMTVAVVDDREHRGMGSEGSRAVGDREMEEIKSIGERHEIEWNDTVNLATSAWWFNFLHSTESEDEFDTSPRVDPAYSVDANFELPCMKIEDIAGLDEEWLY